MRRTQKHAALLLGGLLSLLHWPSAWSQQPPQPSLNAQTAPPLPSPHAQLVRARVFPPAVFLGERFVYRIELKLQPGESLQLESPPRLKGAQLLGEIEQQRRAGRLILQLPLAIFLVPHYGPLRLPPFALTFHDAAGATHKRRLPGPQIEVRARYASTHSFFLRQDPKLAFLKDNKSPMPSHEWRIIPRAKPRRSAEHQQLYRLLGLVALAGLFLLGLWRRRQRKKPTEAPPLTLLERTLQELRALPPPPPGAHEMLRQRCDQMIGILRDYLQQILPTPNRHLTARELCEALAPAPPPWLAMLSALFEESEPLCFGPDPLLETVESFPALQEQAVALLQAIDAWATAQATAQTKPSSQPQRTPHKPTHTNQKEFT